MTLLRRLLLAVLTVFCLLAAALLLASAYSPWLDPTAHSRLSCLGLAFPLCVVANVVLLVLCLAVRSPLRALIPLLVLALCMHQLRAYCPINVGTKEPDESCIKILSYNVMGFATSLKDTTDSHTILTYLNQSGAHIVCLQEYRAGRGRHELTQRLIDRALSDTFPYHHIASAQPRGGGLLACYSRYPIVSTERVTMTSGQNGAIAYRISLPQGDTLCLVNTHLETNQLNPEDREIYEGLLHSPDRSTAEAGLRHLLDKLSQAAAIRAPQADSLVHFVSRQLDRERSAPSPRLLLAVCGDFNDSPICYTHRRLSSCLRDAYARAGNGPGFSYNRNHFLFRIDHFFVDRRLEVVDCRVDRSINASDHYPIVATLALP